MEDLLKLRDEIDKIDNEIVSLYERTRTRGLPEHIRNNDIRDIAPKGDSILDDYKRHNKELN